MSDVASETRTATGATGPVTATAAVLREHGHKLELEEVEMAELQADEVLVRIKGVGICHTDISAAQGKVPMELPAVLGHEGAGVVEAVGPDVERLQVGDHVAISYDHCRECGNCTERTPAYCELFAPLNYFGARLDGTTTMSKGDEEIHGNWFGQSSFATYAIANQRNAVKVSKELPIELLGPLGCGFQTGAGSVLNVLQPKAGEGIAIFGMGGVGLAAIMAAKFAKCDPIIAVDVNPTRLELAKEFGATNLVNPEETKDVVWEVHKLTTNGVHHSMDCVGIPGVIRLALESLRSPGHCVTVGFQGLEHEITVDQGHLLLGRRLTGVIEGDVDPQEFVPKLIEMYQAGDFPFDQLITTYPLDQINEAVEASESGEVIKPVIVLDD